MKLLVFLLFPILINAASSFITQEEYAAQLYQNPRGIGCNMCHGDNGEGRLIAKYKHKNKPRVFRAPAINTTPYPQFYKTLNKRVIGMPRYFLTKKEIDALYLYLHRDNKKGAKNGSKD